MKIKFDAELSLCARLTELQIPDCPLTQKCIRSVWTGGVLYVTDHDDSIRVTSFKNNHVLEELFKSYGR